MLCKALAVGSKNYLLFFKNLFWVEKVHEIWDFHSAFIRDDFLGLVPVRAFEPWSLAQQRHGRRKCLSIPNSKVAPCISRCLEFPLRYLFHDSAYSWAQKLRFLQHCLRHLFLDQNISDLSMLLLWMCLIPMWGNLVRKLFVRNLLAAFSYH